MPRPRPRQSPGARPRHRCRPASSAEPAEPPTPPRQSPRAGRRPEAPARSEIRRRRPSVLRGATRSTVKGARPQTRYPGGDALQDNVSAAVCRRCAGGDDGRRVQLRGHDCPEHRTIACRERRGISRGIDCRRRHDRRHDDHRLGRGPRRRLQPDDRLHVHQGHRQQRHQRMHGRVPDDLAGADRASRNDADGRAPGSPASSGPSRGPTTARSRSRSTACPCTSSRRTRHPATRRGSTRTGTWSCPAGRSLQRRRRRPPPRHQPPPAPRPSSR